MHFHPLRNEGVAPQAWGDVFASGEQPSSSIPFLWKGEDKLVARMQMRSIGIRGSHSLDAATLHPGYVSPDSINKYP